MFMLLRVLLAPRHVVLYPLAPPVASCHLHCLPVMVATALVPQYAKHLLDGVKQTLLLATGGTQGSTYKGRGCRHKAELEA